MEEMRIGTSGMPTEKSGGGEKGEKSGGAMEMTEGSESGMPKSPSATEKEMSLGKSGMPMEFTSPRPMQAKEVCEFELTSMAVFLEVKEKLAEELSARIFSKMLTWLNNIEDEGKRVDVVSEFRRCLLNHKQMEWSISDPVDIQSGKIEELARQVETLSREMSSSMVGMLTPKPTDHSFVTSFLLYTQQLDHMCQDIKKMLKSFSIESLRSHFTSEGNLLWLSNLQSISESLDMLRNLEPTLHHKLGKLVDDEEMNSKEESVEEPVMGRDDSKSTARIEVEDFDAFRSSWELLRCPARKFEDMTLSSPMIFTHCTPGSIPRDAIVGSTLQIYSVRVAELHQVEGADLSWPLEVYGVVAARDTMDSSRNPIFLRPRQNCQMLTLQDPFLHLMGPSRAILSMDLVSIELQLNVKGRVKSEDRKLISKVCHYNGGRFERFLVHDSSCTIELCGEQVNQSVQATISRARVIEEGSLPSQYGGRLFCCSLPEGATEDATDQCQQIVMLDSKDGTLPMGKHKCFDLSRSVVVVELEGRLKVTIEAYAQSGTITGDVLFTPQKCGITKDKCYLGDSVVEITVAWSLLPLPKKS